MFYPIRVSLVWSWMLFVFCKFTLTTFYSRVPSWYWSCCTSYFCVCSTLIVFYSGSEKLPSANASVQRLLRQKISSGKATRHPAQPTGIVIKTPTTATHWRPQLRIVGAAPVLGAGFVSFVLLPMLCSLLHLILSWQLAASETHELISYLDIRFLFRRQATQQQRTQLPSSSSVNWVKLEIKAT